MSDDPDTRLAVLKIAVAWIGALFGSITLNQVAVVCTIGFTILQSYKLIRDMRKEARLERLEAKLKGPAP